MELRPNFKLQGQYTLDKQRKLVRHATLETMEDVAETLGSTFAYGLKIIRP